MISIMLLITPVMGIAKITPNKPLTFPPNKMADQITTGLNTVRIV
ncbi:hypothetical protein AmaxDRAFT_0606 [Limnospira maxima CS-328]|uniref:Uncharacterized protein n=1 Tax=Limnospira maxima CS-328 TaxID=513049 RepID=B5VVR4_LIMMA|nr:hypothetical protein AmaxDRAFT_0606 [Limnospira maxima CS-328]UWU48015.1 hypothetical protein APLC1_2802 [Arthrospira platensis C1]